MEQKEAWIPPDAPLSEGYWQALLQDGEDGKPAPAIESAAIWVERTPEDDTAPEQQVDRADLERAWEKARHLMDTRDTVKPPVIGCNRGGVLVAWNGLRGFVPASHLLDLASEAGKERHQEALKRYIGRRLPLKIIEIDRQKDRLILSERATRMDSEQDESLLEQLRPGDVCEGRVSNLCSFGAFVDLGGFEGLVHISELSWGRVEHPREVLEPGQLVDVYVLNVEPERDRVGLSVKHLQPNPWQSVEARYRVGEVLTGTVTHVVDFGAFVEIEEGLEGLIHVSELGIDMSDAPHDALEAGDVVSVTVLSIEGERHRMGLRLEELRSGSETSASTASHDG